MNTKAAIVLAAGLLIVAFGVGLGVGRSTHQRRLASVKPSAKAQRHLAASRELAACREELATLSMPATRSSAADGVPDEAIAAEELKEVVLEHELRQCRTKDMVLSATMCTTANRYFFLLLAGLHADKACVDKFGIGDLILKHTEQCAKFADNQGDPAEMNLGKMSNAELSNFYDAQRYGRVNELRRGDHKAILARHFERTYRDCHTKFGLSDK